MNLPKLPGFRAGAPASTAQLDAAGVYAHPFVRAILGTFLPLLVGAIRIIGGLGCIIALLSVHFYFGREGFANAITHGVTVNFFGLRQWDVSPLMLSTMLELVSLAAQTVLWDMRLTRKAASWPIQALFWAIMFLCGLVSVSVLTKAMYAEETLNILPLHRSPGYIALAIMVGLLTMYDSKYIAVIISAMQRSGNSLLFGNGAVRNFLHRTSMTIVSIVRIVIMTAGTLSLLALSWVLMEVTLTLMLPNDSGLIVSLLAFATVSVPVVLAEIMLYSKLHLPSLETKLTLGAIVVLIGVMCAAAVPYIMFGDNPVNIFAAREHFKPMYLVLSALVGVYALGDSYLIYWFLESLRNEQGASQNQPPAQQP